MLLCLAAGQAPPPSAEDPGPAVVAPPTLQALTGVPPHEHEDEPGIDPGEIDELKRWIYALEDRVAAAERQAAGARQERAAAAGALRIHEAELAAQRDLEAARESQVARLEAAAAFAADLEGRLARGETGLDAEAAALVGELRAVAGEDGLLPQTLLTLAAQAHDAALRSSERLDHSDLFQARGHLSRAVALLRVAVTSARAD